MAADEPIVLVRSSGREIGLPLGNSDDRVPTMIRGRCGVDVRDQARQIVLTGFRPVPCIPDPRRGMPEGIAGFRIIEGAEEPCRRGDGVRSASGKARGASEDLSETITMPRDDPSVRRTSPAVSKSAKSQLRPAEFLLRVGLKR
jgi:hypothetical protein